MPLVPLDRRSASSTPQVNRRSPIDPERVIAQFDEAIDLPREGLIKLAAKAGPRKTWELTLVTGADPDMDVPGIGGWESSQRPGLPAARWYKSPGDGSLALDVAIDTRVVGGPDMERRLEVLASMGRKDRDTGEPPKLRIIGGHLPLATGLWVMQPPLSLGAQVVQNGVLVRQQVSIALEPFERVDPIGPVRPGRTRASSTAKRRRREIRSTKGDTLRAIAVRQLGYAGGWREIRSWNPKLKKVDPDETLRTGTRVVLR